MKYDFIYKFILKNTSFLSKYNNIHVTDSSGTEHFIIVEHNKVHEYSPGQTRQL